MSNLKIKSLKLAQAITGSLSKPSKMPCYGYSIPVSACNTGGKLRSVAGSVCEKCYADGRGNYRFSNVQSALYFRLQSMLHNPQWADAMIRQILGEEYFRWFDSGDIPNWDVLLKIVYIAEQLPDTAFWLPTKEKALINKYLKQFGAFPSNLTVRLSAPMIDMVISHKQLPTSAVAGKKSDTLDKIGVHCSAPKNDGKCGKCRACWNPEISVIVYKQH